MSDEPESQLVSRLNATAATEGPWCCGPVECLECGAKWIGVWPLGADNLECACGSTDTVREHEQLGEHR